MLFSTSEVRDRRTERQAEPLSQSSERPLPKKYSVFDNARAWFERDVSLGRPTTSTLRVPFRAPLFDLIEHNLRTDAFQESARVCAC